MDFEERIVNCLKSITSNLYTYFSLNIKVIATPAFKKNAGGNKEMVTEADKKVEEICFTFLSAEFPEIHILSEERYRNGNCLPETGWSFIIDPIDGTEEFARGSNEWSVSIAAVNDLVPRVGMLFMPHNNLKITARRGKGVFCNGREITPKRQGERKLRIAVSPRQIKVPELKAKIQRSGLSPVLVPTLTVKIISILLNKVDAGVYFPQRGKTAKVWDYAAALLLIEEFGGKMTSLDGSPMPFQGEGIIHKGGWLATNPFCEHKSLLSKLQE